MTSTTITDRAGLFSTLAVKAPVKWVSTSNRTLSGVDSGHAADDRHLVVGQTDASENGIYLESSGTWTRAKDFDGARDIVKGTLIPSPTSGVFYQITSSDPHTVGTSDIDITGFDLPISAYDAAAYGAAHNTDSSAAITSALNAASAANAVATVPGGTLQIDTEITWPSAGAKLKGQGIGKTILKYTGGASSSVFVNENPSSSSPLVTDVGTYVSATSFKVPTDRTASYRKGRRIYITGATTGAVFPLVETVSYSAPDTTVTIDASVLQNEALTASAMELPTTSGLSTFTDHDIELEDLTIDGNSLAVRGIFLKGVSGVRLKNVEIKGTTTGHGLRAIYCDGLWAENCYWHHCGGNGAGISISDHVYLKNCRAEYNGDMGNTLNCVRDGVMEGCTGMYNTGSGGSFEANGTSIGDAIADARNENLRLIGYTGDKNGAHGFLLATKGSHYFQIIGGMFGWNTKSGIAGAGGASGPDSYATITEYGIIMGAMCHDNTQYGIEGASEGTSYMRRMVALGNVCSNNGLDGLALPATTNIEDWVIVSNLAIDTQSVQTQDTGIKVQHAGSDRVLIVGNSLGSVNSLSVVAASDGLVDCNLLPDKTRDHDVAGVSVPSNGTTIDLADGCPVIRLVGTAGTIAALTGFQGQRVRIHNTLAGAATVTNGASLRCPVGVDLSLEQHENVTFTCIADGVWTTTGNVDTTV